MANWILSKKSKNRRVKQLLIVLLLTAEILGVGVYTWKRTKPIGETGFIVKNGEKYLLVWKSNDTEEPRALTYATLNDAVSFARDELELEIGPRVGYEDVLEHSWIRDDVGRYVLYWKTFRYEFLNRLSFKSSAEAHFFEEAFRRGAYATSPLGHSLALVKSRHSPKM